jgi:hypothetical protein
LIFVRESKGTKMVFWLQIVSATTGIAAAVLWFRSTVVKPPPMIADGGVPMQRFLDGAAHFNKWAAGVTAISVLLSVIATLLSGIWG